VSPSISDALRQAYASGERVMIHRDRVHPDADVLGGIVSAIGSAWFVLATYDDSVYFDGWNVLRVDDVSEVEVEPEDFQQYTARVASRLDPAPAIPLAILEALTAPATEVPGRIASSVPLVGLFAESEEGPDVLFIGRALPQRGGDVALLEIDSAGRWFDETSVFAPEEITRLTIGGRYQDALEEFGEPFPRR
jgi:hypothetical protein